MKKWIGGSLIVALVPLAVSAQTKAPSKDAAAPTARQQAHRKEDIARHRQISKAHEEAARCLEGGATEKECHAKLRDACKGIAVGQYCGMRHAH